MAKYTFEFKKEVIAEYLKHDKTTKEILDKYLNWFKTKRIKERLGYLSPMDYRTSLGY